MNLSFGSGPLSKQTWPPDPFRRVRSKNGTEGTQNQPRKPIPMPFVTILCSTTKTKI